MAFIQETAEGIILSVKVIPKSSRNEIVGTVGECLKIKLTAAPEGGKANKLLIQFLADTLKLNKSYITIIKGKTTGRKLLRIRGIDKDTIDRMLSLKRET